MKHYYSLTAVLLMIMGMTACSSDKSKTPAYDNLKAIQKSDSLPSSVKMLVKSVADTSAQKFADLVSYPLERPYPLQNIEDKNQMLSYYGIMVDDSLRNVILAALPSQWGEYGWRGWTLEDGQYIWLDDESIYTIPYLSRKEAQMLDSLQRLEISTLAPSLRVGAWVPVECLKSDTGKEIFRIDLNKEPGRNLAYRMVMYKGPEQMRLLPTRIYKGYVETEGTALVSTYHFTAPDGTTADYTPDSPDGTSRIIFGHTNSPDTYLEVQPAYWLLLLPKK